jgi:glycolate oxidase FAD binding subunit
VAGFPGSRETVERQVRDLEHLILEQRGSVRLFQEVDSTKAWAAITNVFRALPQDPFRVLCTLAVPIGETVRMMASARTWASELGLAPTLSAHAGSGILRVAFQPVAGSTAEDGEISGMVAAIEILRGEAAAAGGSLVIQEAPLHLKERVDAWGRPGPAFTVMRRVKAEFDPQGLCSPGRFLGGI